jgi:hypothetical protein
MGLKYIVEYRVSNYQPLNNIHVQIIKPTSPPSRFPCTRVLLFLAPLTLGLSAENENAGNSLASLVLFLFHPVQRVGT